MEEVAKNYATALYRLVDEKDRPAYLKALRDTEGLFASYPDLERVLCSYSLYLQEKQALCDQIFLRLYPLPYLNDFYKVLVRHHRFNLFSSVVSSFASLVNESLGILEGVVYSAAPLSEEEKKRIEDALAERLGDKVELTPILDPDLLGGVKVALDGKVYDGSLRHKLQEMKKHLLQGGKDQ